MPEDQYKDKRKRLLQEYHDSPIRRLNQTFSSCSELRPGDILCRKLNGGASSNSKSNSGSYSGDTGGVGIHYCIYVKKLGDKEHQIIEKGESSNGEYCIKLVTKSESDLMDNYSIVYNCRYSDTVEMALQILRQRTDAGYSVTHANCEHFVTFCLTRSTEYCCSRQALVGTVVRDVAATVSGGFFNTLKLISHPFYMLGGDMSFQERMIKTVVPFGFDSEAVARNEVFIIGSSYRGLTIHYYEF